MFSLAKKALIVITRVTKIINKGTQENYYIYLNNLLEYQKNGTTYSEISEMKRLKDFD